MKKIFTVALFCICSLQCFSESLFDGSWQVENVVYTFVDDSLFIDEVGVEGDAYTYQLEGDQVTATNALGDVITFMIQKTMINTVEIAFSDEKFELIRVSNYDYVNAKFVK